MSNLAPSPQAYRQNAVLAAAPEQLVVMLYDGARRFLRQASIAMRGREIERAHNALRRAELIIAYLDGILDHDQPDIPQQLHQIYLFCLTHLNSARMSQDAAKLEEVSDLLGELRESWVQVAEGAARAGAA
jgi:flagellar secretion chaperone FliS